MVSNSDIIEVIKLYRNFVRYNRLSDKDIAKSIIPSLSLNQFNIFRYPTTSVAYAFTNWAFLNKEVEERFKIRGVLDNLDWNSGDICWHIETINTAQDKINGIYKWTANRLSNDIGEDKYCNWIRTNKSGIGIKRINKMKISTGLKKFK
jgi:hemolysin-activating ACP:hemolysin acyltransferase|tara:strand:- start:569 stop:1015 length:447 start_codon:yes stop_codon:yes gene_type:complete